MTAIPGAAAALTGAASGIGRALALELAARGCDLALADRDEAGLQTLATEIAGAHSRKVTVHRLDVGEPGQIADFAAAATAIPASTSSSTMPASRCSASSARSTRPRWTG
jgi:short-subunit dehydrogenase